MKTYSAYYKSGRALFEKKSAQEIFNLISAGSRLISGNSETTDHKGNKTTNEVKATYKRGTEYFTITENKMNITLNEQIGEVQREISMREAVYPRLVISGKLSLDEAQKRTEIMKSVLGTLQNMLPKVRGEEKI